MTFTSWLRKQQKRDDPVGDLARDGFAQEQGQENIRRGSTPDWWKRHLKRYDACDNAFLALRRAKREYLKP